MSILIPTNAPMSPPADPTGMSSSTVFCARCGQAAMSDGSCADCAKLQQASAPPAIALDRGY